MVELQRIRSHGARALHRVVDPSRGRPLARHRHTDGKLVMFLAIDRVSKFTYVEFHDSAGKKEGAAFLGNVVAAFPYINPHRANR